VPEGSALRSSPCTAVILCAGSRATYRDRMAIKTNLTPAQVKKVIAEAKIEERREERRDKRRRATGWTQTYVAVPKGVYGTPPIFEDGPCVTTKWVPPERKPRKPRQKKEPSNLIQPPIDFGK
jgi:hypothetical protein